MVYYQESRGDSFKEYVKKQGTYCLKCKKKKKKRTDNKSITAKAAVNKLVSQKLICANCGAKKLLLLLKEYKPDKMKK